MGCEVQRTGLLDKDTLNSILKSHDNEFIQDLDYSKQRQVVTVIAEDLYKSQLKFDAGKLSTIITDTVMKSFLTDLNNNLENSKHVEYKYYDEFNNYIGTFIYRLCLWQGQGS